jgi:amino acid transporter
MFTALVAGLLPIGEVAELVNIGTLSAFIIICASIMVLRVRKPDLQRKFKTPAVWFTAPLGILFSLVLIYGLPWITYERFASGWRWAVSFISLRHTTQQAGGLPRHDENRCGCHRPRASHLPRA